MQKFERADFEVQEYVESENYGKFVLSPLERGFGTTIGNALRRVLLSFLFASWTILPKTFTYVCR